MTAFVSLVTRMDRALAAARSMRVDDGRITHMDDEIFRRVPATLEGEDRHWVPNATTISEEYGPQGWEATDGEPVAVDGVPETYEWVLRRTTPSGGPRLHG